MSLECETRFRRGLRTLADKIRLRSCPLIRACIAEFCGTAILIIFGCGVLAQVFLGDHGKKSHGGFLSVSLGWGMAVTFGVFFSGITGSGNINPAITLAFALIGKVPLKRIPFYTISQVLGAYVGAATVYVIYREKIIERVNTVDEGLYLVDTTGNIFVTNPWASHTTCFIDQVIGTALLSAGALAVVDYKGWKMPRYLHPLYLGLLVYTLVGCFAMNAGCALNPARDLGPRLMLLMCGWGTSAFRDKDYFFWIPIVGPYVGAVIGAVLYELTIGIHLDTAGERLAIETPGKANDTKKDESGTELLA
uniref:Aquaporin 2 n=1 Tax=Opisthorchis viverrini TaxID=6198 RepID=A0A060CZT8_OPIVI|nr:aquaporin 2 [Opisthorchis viverrini]